MKNHNTFYEEQSANRFSYHLLVHFAYGTPMMNTSTRYSIILKRRSQISSNFIEVGKDNSFQFFFHRLKIVKFDFDKSKDNSIAETKNPKDKKAKEAAKDKVKETEKEKAPFLKSASELT